MEKSDISKKNICIAAIDRHTIKPFDFAYTKVYREENFQIESSMSNAFELEESEELICSTYIDSNIWSLLTTRRIISIEGVGLRVKSLKDIDKWDFGDFKGYSKQPYTKGFVHFTDGDSISFFTETGRASMVMIYGIMTINKMFK